MEFGLNILIHNKGVPKVTAMNMPIASSNEHKLLENIIIAKMINILFFIVTLVSLLYSE